MKARFEYEVWILLGGVVHIAGCYATRNQALAAIRELLAINDRASAGYTKRLA